jgi:hypothetical protein
MGVELKNEVLWLTIACCSYRARIKQDYNGNAMIILAENDSRFPIRGKMVQRPHESRPSATTPQHPRGKCLANSDLMAALIEHPDHASSTSKYSESAPQASALCPRLPAPPNSTDHPTPQRRSSPPSPTQFLRLRHEHPS